MTGAEIDRLDAGPVIVLVVRGAFDGASAWELRNTMDESAGTDFLVDLRGAVEAFDFAACVLAGWARARRATKRVRFVVQEPGQARLLAAHGLETVGTAEAPEPWRLRAFAGQPARRDAVA